MFNIIEQWPTNNDLQITSPKTVGIYSCTKWIIVKIVLLVSNVDTYYHLYAILTHNDVMINVVLWCNDKRWRNPKGQLWMDNSEIITTLATKDTRRRQKQTNKQTNNHKKTKNMNIWFCHYCSWNTAISNAHQ